MSNTDEFVVVQSAAVTEIAPEPLEVFRPDTTVQEEPTDLDQGLSPPALIRSDPVYEEMPSLNLMSYTGQLFGADNSLENYSSSEHVDKSFIEALFESGSVIETDRDDRVSVYSYKESVGRGMSKPNRVRGVVVSRGGAVVSSMPYLPDFNVSYIETDKLMPAPDSRWTVVDLPEGVMVRVFHASMFDAQVSDESKTADTDGWYFASTRKLNAFSSRRNSPVTLGHRFYEGMVNANVIDNSLAVSIAEEVMRSGASPDSELAKRKLLAAFAEKNLSKSVCYTFLVSNDKEDRMVCNYPDHAWVKLVGGSVQGIDGLTKFSTDYTVPGVESLSPVNSVVPSDNEAFTNYVNSLDPKWLQGVLVVDKFSVLPPMRVMSNDYHRLFHIRGNVQSPSFSYISNMFNRGKKDAFRSLYPAEEYPELNEQFNRLDDALFDLAGNLSRVYIARVSNPVHNGRGHRRRDMETRVPVRRPGVPEIQRPAFDALCRSFTGRARPTEFKHVIPSTYRVLSNMSRSVLNEMLKNQIEYKMSRQNANSNSLLE